MNACKTRDSQCPFISLAHANQEVAMHDITRRSAVKLTMATAVALGGIVGSAKIQQARAEGVAGQIDVSDHQHPSFGSLSAYTYFNFKDEQYSEGSNGQTYDALYYGDDFFVVAFHYEANGATNITGEGEIEDAINTYLANDTFILNAPIKQSNSYSFQRIEDLDNNGNPFITYQAGPYSSSSKGIMSFAFCGQDGGLLIVTGSNPWDPSLQPGPEFYCVTGSVDCVTGEPSSLQAAGSNEAQAQSGFENAICTQWIETEEGPRSYACQWDTECTFLTVDGGVRTVKHLFLETIDHAPTAADMGRYVQGFLITSGNHRIHWAGNVTAANLISISAFWYWPGVVKYPVVATSYDIDGFHWFGFDPIEGDFRLS